MQSVHAERREVCAPSLMRLAARLAGGSDEADDLVQATMVRALEHDVPVDRVPWLRRVLTNERNMWLRSRTRRAKRESVHADVPEPAGADDVVHALELAEIVRGLVEELEPATRTVVEARYFEGRTAADVARNLGVPAGTVRWRLKQGLDTLRTRLDRRYGGRRALWAGAAMSFEKPPTLAAATASKGAMSFKVSATLAALFAVGTAGTVALRSSGSEASEPAPAPNTPAGAVPTKVHTATSDRSPAARNAKQVWAQQRTEIRRKLVESSEVAAAGAAASSDAHGHTSFDSTKLVGELSAIVGMCSDFMTGDSSNLHLTAHVIGAPGTGTIVEDVTLSEDSEATAPLSECLTESMYTLDLGEVSTHYEEDLQLYLQNSLTGPMPHELMEGASITLQVPGEVPEEMREALEEALAEAGEGHEGEGPKVMMMNEQGVAESKSLDDLPPEVRKMAEAAIEQAKSEHEAAPQPE